MAAHPFAEISFQQLVEMPPSTLERAFQKGLAPRRERLVGFEFRGYRTCLVARLLGRQRFVKGFFVDPSGRALGYDLGVERVQGALAKAWIPKHGGGPAERRGFHEVLDDGLAARVGGPSHALLLDYGTGSRRAARLRIRHRAFLVQVEPDNPDLYIGKSYFEVERFRIFASYFVLERLWKAPLAAVGPAPALRPGP